MVHQDEFCHQHHLDGINSNLIGIIIRQYLRVPYKIIAQISNQSAAEGKLLVVLHNVKLAVVFLQAFQRIALPHLSASILLCDYQRIALGCDNLLRLLSEKCIAVIILVITFQKKALLFSHQTLIHISGGLIYNTDRLLVYAQSSFHNLIPFLLVTIHSPPPISAANSNL